MLSREEEEEFFALHRKTSEALFAKAYRMCRGHEADAKDAVQRAYVQALTHWQTVGDLSDSKRKAWLATTVTHEVLQIWRSRDRLREVSSGEGTGGQQALTPDIDSSVDNELLLHKACRAIAALDGRPREVMALHCLAGYEIPEVAEMLGISSATVRVCLHNGRMRLREIMTGEVADS
jgi:RNA polymerase sigma factor (sigma-70 family)